MTNRRDLTNERFGRLVAVEFSHRHVSPNGSPASMWRCRCDCGNEGLYRLGSLRSGQARSCGCTRREATIKRNTKHGLSHTSEHYIWKAMKRRCDSPKNADYKNYGGRGIKVCDAWRNDFAQFLADVGPRPSNKHTIDRIDTNGDYEPKNVRWVPMSEQSKNRRCVRRAMFRGNMLSASEIAERVGLNSSQVFYKVFCRGVDPNDLWGGA